MMEDPVNVAPTVNYMEKLPRRSISLSVPPAAMVAGAVSRRGSFSYTKLREGPLKLSVLKLDGSSFEVQVIKSATVAELKLAIQNVFCHIPTEGPEKISWPHVWGHFCLCYDDQKLVEDTQHIISYGIKDGDKIHFVRHISSMNNLTKIRSKKKTGSRKFKESYLPVSGSTSSFESEQNDEDNYDDTENGHQISRDVDDDKRTVVVDQECQFGQFLRGCSSQSKKKSSSINRTASSKCMLIQSRDGNGGNRSRDGRSLLVNVGKIFNLWGTKYSSNRSVRKDQ